MSDRTIGGVWAVAERTSGDDGSSFQTLPAGSRYHLKTCSVITSWEKTNGAVVAYIDGDDAWSIDALSPCSACIPVRPSS